ncbi:MAG: peroxiredoxin-like family protein [Sedimenticola sp.]
MDRKLRFQVLALRTETWDEAKRVHMLPDEKKKSLADLCREHREVSMQKLPAATQQVLQDASRRLMDSDYGVQALRSGDACVDFTLPDSHGRGVNLKQLLNIGPVVLSFYRGSWCPYCNLEIRALAGALPEITAAGARLVAVSPELPEHNRFDTGEIGPGLDLLCDRGNRIARQYGLLMEVYETLRPLYLEWGMDIPGHNGDDSWLLPIPATYVIGRDGIIKAHYVDKNYTARMEPADIIEALKQIQLAAAEMDPHPP